MIPSTTSVHPTSSSNGGEGFVHGYIAQWRMKGEAETSLVQGHGKVADGACVQGSTRSARQSANQNRCGVAWPFDHDQDELATAWPYWLRRTTGRQKAGASSRTPHTPQRKIRVTTSPSPCLRAAAAAADLPRRKRRAPLVRQRRLSDRSPGPAGARYVHWWRGSAPLP